MEMNAKGSHLRLPRLARWFLAVTFSIFSSMAYFAYMSNGVVAGALIGLPGREGEIAVAQHNATYWYAAFWAFQLGLVISMFSLLRFGSDAASFPRYLLRGLAAVLLAFPVTIFVGNTIFLALKLLWFHLRVR
jgi:hypothetical protein